MLSVVSGTMRGADRALWITGHSLGGALAILMAARLYESDIDVTGVCTFGQPKTGDSKFKHHYDRALGGRTWRVVYRNDPVPRWMGAIFRHHGTYHGLGKATRCNVMHPGKKGPQRCGDAQISSIADHRISAYCAALGMGVHPGADSPCPERFVPDRTRKRIVSR